MKKTTYIFLIAAAFLSSCHLEKKGNTPSLNCMNIEPPAANKIPKTFKEHGHERSDAYFWLQEKNNPEVMRYLALENAYCDTFMRHTAALQETLYEEMKGRIKEEDTDVPVLNNGYYYTRETKQGKQYPVFSRTKKGSGNAKEILLDGNEMAKGQTTLLVGGLQVSPDNEWMAYASNFTGSYMQFTLQFVHLKDKKNSKEKIDNVDGFAWSNDNKTLFYVVCNEALRPYRVYKHLIGTDPEKDKLVYEEKDALFNVSIRKDKTGSFLLIHSESFTSAETLFLSADTPDAAFETFYPRSKDVQYTVEPHKKEFFIHYKDDRNKNFKVFRAPLAGFKDKKNWQEFVAYDPDTKIEGIQAFEKFLAVSIRHNGLLGIRMIFFTTTEIKNVSFPEAVYDLEVLDNPEYSSSTLRYLYSSLNRPETVYDYDTETNTSNKLKEQEIPSGFYPEAYVVQRVFATASDGIKVPVALVYKKGRALSGKNPLLLTGYGSYGISNDAGFNRNVISLLDRGFVYAIAQVRGGSDLGETWYDDGKLFKKKNTFTDFIAAAEHLIREKYTAPEYLAIQGRSAGGLLMGAVVNMRPDLFKVAVADVPFVDVINTMSDASLPLTTQEYEQWGNPNEKKAYEYMLSYSPYENIKKAAFPNILATAGFNDSQVGYHEAAKWIAKLRENTTSDNALLLKVNLSSGHGGASGRFDRLKEFAFTYAFIIDRLGVQTKNP